MSRSHRASGGQLHLVRALLLTLTGICCGHIKPFTYLHCTLQGCGVNVALIRLLRGLKNSPKWVTHHQECYIHDFSIFQDLISPLFHKVSVCNHHLLPIILLLGMKNDCLHKQ